MRLVSVTIFLLGNKKLIYNLINYFVWKCSFTQLLSFNNTLLEWGIGLFVTSIAYERDETGEIKSRKFFLFICQNFIFNEIWIRPTFPVKKEETEIHLSKTMRHSTAPIMACSPIQPVATGTTPVTVAKLWNCGGAFQTGSLILDIVAAIFQNRQIVTLVIVRQILVQ